MWEQAGNARKMSLECMRLFTKPYRAKRWPWRIQLITRTSAVFCTTHLAVYICMYLLAFPHDLLPLSPLKFLLPFLEEQVSWQTLYVGLRMPFKLSRNKPP